MQQGAARDRCEKIAAGPLGDCKPGSDSPLKAISKLVNVKPAFMTGEILVDLVSLASGVNYSTSAARSPQPFRNAAFRAHPVREASVGTTN
jgi:hypothetical protein